MEKQNTQESKSGLEESAVQQDIHSIHTEQTVSDRQQNTFGKDQSEMIYAELVGLPEGKFKQKPETTIYSTIIQSQLSSSEKQEDQSQPLNNKGESLKKNNFDIDEDTGWGTTLSSDNSQNDRQHERISKSTKNDNDSLEIQFEKTQPNPQTNSNYKSFFNELIRKAAEKKSEQNLATSSHLSGHPIPAPRYSKLIIVENSAGRLLGVNENTGWCTFLGTEIPQREKPIPLPRTIKNAQKSKKNTPAQCTFKDLKDKTSNINQNTISSSNDLNLANGVETDNILSSGNSQSVMINKSLYHLNGRAGIITNVTPDTRHNIDKTTGSNINR